MADENQVAEKTTEPKAAALNYPASAALAKPKKGTPPPGKTGGGGGGRPDESVLETMKTLLADRGEWYQVVEEVANSGKWYDAFKAQGCEVRVKRVAGKTLRLTDADGKIKEVPVYDIWAMLPPGEIRPWKKGKSKRGSGTGTHAPTQSSPPAGGGKVLPGPGSGGRR